jgi:hypothetical protein
MNGIIEYDQKLISLPRFLLIHQSSPKKSYWNIIFIFALIYYIATTIYNIHTYRHTNTLTLTGFPRWLCPLDHFLLSAIYKYTHNIHRSVDTYQVFWWPGRAHIINHMLPARTVRFQISKFHRYIWERWENKFNFYRCA